MSRASFEAAFSLILILVNGFDVLLEITRMAWGTVPWEDTSKA